MRFRGRQSWETFFLDMAQQAANRATCPRRSVGAVLATHDNRLLAIGYNGAPRGVPHCLDVGCMMDGDHCVRAVHAEVNALLNVEVRPNGPILYVTSSPCIRCASLIVQAGVTRVVYREAYKDLDLVTELFKSMKVALVKETRGA